MKHTREEIYLNVYLDGIIGKLMRIVENIKYTHFIIHDIYIHR